MADLIIKQNKRPVRQDIITNTEGYNVSKRYVPIATDDVLNEMRETVGDIKITGFNNANVRKAEKQSFQKHAIICELPDASMADGTTMNLIIFNSNDRSTSLRIHTGIFRAICENGMVLGEDFLEPTRIRHTQQDWKHSIHTLLDDFRDNQKRTNDMINQMMSRILSNNNTEDFCNKVVKEFDSEITGEILDPMQFNQVKRKEDKGKDLWHTFNRIQEALLTGGINRIIEKSDEDGVLFTTTSKTHRITDTAKQIRFNQKLHSMALEYL